MYFCVVIYTLYNVLVILFLILFQLICQGNISIQV